MSHCSRPLVSHPASSSRANTGSGLPLWNLALPAVARARPAARLRIQLTARLTHQDGTVQGATVRQAPPQIPRTRPSAPACLSHPTIVESAPQGTVPNQPTPPVRRRPSPHPRHTGSSPIDLSGTQHSSVSYRGRRATSLLSFVGLSHLCPLFPFLSTVCGLGGHRRRPGRRSFIRVAA
jgi:hypothetical protein